jgi:hypothetical protein
MLIVFIMTKDVCRPNHTSGPAASTEWKNQMETMENRHGAEKEMWDVICETTTAPASLPPTVGASVQNNLLDVYCWAHTYD